MTYPEEVQKSLVNEPIFSRLPDGSWVENTAIAEVAIISKSANSLVVSYTVAPNAKWSDGVAATAEDLLVFHLTAKSPTADLMFRNNTTSIYASAIQGNPVISNSSRTITFTFNDSAWDWQASIGFTKPAHILGKAVRPELTTEEAKQQVAADALSGVSSQAMADAWNNIYNLTQQGATSVNSVSFGPYKLKQVSTGRITFERNPNYSGSRVFAFDEISQVNVADMSQVGAMFENGTIDVMDATPANKTIFDSWSSIPSARTIAGTSGLLEHFDIRTGSADGAAYNHPFSGSSQRALDLRKALLLSLPREAIQDQILVGGKLPLPKNSQGLSPLEQNHDLVSSDAGFAAYLEEPAQRLASAKAIVKSYYPDWDGSALTAPITVRVLWGTPSNSRRSAQINLIAASAATAGFSLTTSGSSSWATSLTSSQYDATVYALSPDTTSSGGHARTIAQYQGFSNATLTQLLDELKTQPTSSRRLQIQKDIEALLNQNAFTLPLYYVPFTRIARQGLLATAPFGNDMPSALSSWRWGKDAIPTQGSPTIYSPTGFKVGSSLSVNPGVWTEGVTFTYKWMADGEAVSDGTASSTYQIQGLDLGKRLSVEVRASLPEHEDKVIVLSSAELASKGQLSSTATVRVTGPAKPGGEIVAYLTGFPEEATASYRWFKNGKVIPGQTSSTYLVTVSDVGAKISAEVTASLFGYTSQVSVSGFLLVVAPPLAPKGTVAITGSALVGKTLASKVSRWPSGVSFRYEWLRNGVPIKGATKATYKVALVDKGKSLSLRITVVKPGFTSAVSVTKALKTK